MRLLSMLRLVKVLLTYRDYPKAVVTPGNRLKKYSHPHSQSPSKAGTHKLSHTNKHTDVMISGAMCVRVVVVLDMDKGVVGYYTCTRACERMQVFMV